MDPGCSGAVSTDIARWQPLVPFRTFASVSVEPLRGTTFSRESGYGSWCAAVLCGVAAVMGAGLTLGYHVGPVRFWCRFSGERLFYLVEPSLDNIAAFEQWSLSKKKQSVCISLLPATLQAPVAPRSFLRACLPLCEARSSRISPIASDVLMQHICCDLQPIFSDFVPVCHRVRVSEGGTLFVPAGWIFAEVAVTDTVVFTGYFLSDLNVECQIRALDLLCRVAIDQKQRQFLEQFIGAHVFGALAIAQAGIAEPLLPRMHTTALLLARALQRWEGSSQLSVSLTSEVDVHQVQCRIGAWRVRRKATSSGS